jgi:hypothetical protein
MSRITESLSAPGLAITPPDFGGAAKFAELQRALGLTARAAGIAGEMARRERLEREHEEREAEAVLRGEAEHQAKIGLPEWRRRIAEDQISVPDGADPAEYARSLVEGLLPEEAPAAYRDQYAKAAIPALTEALVKRQGERRDQVREDTFARLKDLAAGTLTPESLKLASESAYRDLGVTEDFARGEIGIYAMRAAAERGDADGFAVARDFLGSSHQVEQTQLADVLDRTLAGQAADRDRRFVERIDGLYLDEAPVDRIRAEILAGRGRVSDSVVDAKLQELGQRTVRNFGERYLASERDRIVSRLAPLLEAGDVTGGAAMVEDETIELPSGETRTIKAAEIIDAVRERKWAEIDARTADDPNLNVSLKMEWLAKNPGATDPIMLKLFAGARQRVTAETTDQTIQPALVQAFDLYRTAGAAAERVRDAHLSAVDREFFRISEFLVENMATTPANAMVLAASAMTRDPAVSVTIGRDLTRKALMDAADDLLSGGNQTDVLAAVEQRARAYMIATGLGEEAALKRAAKDFKADHTKINGWWVRTAGRSILQTIDVDAVSRVIVAAYIRQQSEAGKLFEGDERATEDQRLRELASQARGYTLIADRGGGWRVSWQDTGLPAEDSMVFTDADLARIQQVLRGREEAVMRVVRDQAAAEKRQERLNASRAALAQAGIMVRTSYAGAGDVIGGFGGADLSGFENPIEPAPRPADDTPAHILRVINLADRARQRGDLWRAVFEKTIREIEEANRAAPFGAMDLR